MDGKGGESVDAVVIFAAFSWIIVVGGAFLPKGLERVVARGTRRGSPPLAAVAGRIRRAIKAAAFPEEDRPRGRQDEMGRWFKPAPSR